MAHRSGSELLALHGVRVLGGPSVAAVAARFRLAPTDVREHLLDAQAYGWVNRHEHYGETWSLTASGKAEDERRLGAELDAVGCRDVVTAAHRAFLPLNRRHGEACTRWQLRPQPWDALAANDHTDLRWDHAVLTDLDGIDAGLNHGLEPVATELERFGGYAQLHRQALVKVRGGHPEWLDSPAVESCQLIWIQLHEDLLATLGIPRGSDTVAPE